MGGFVVCCLCGQPVKRSEAVHIDDVHPAHFPMKGSPWMHGAYKGCPKHEDFMVGLARPINTLTQSQ